ncbi:MAG: hypothetical protein UHX92_06230 [Acutalibacteraceae bacterium]|nr:hypothetical protein [Acutalibacteraceae bacterium]
MENIKELLDELKSEIINELPEALTPTIEGTVENVVHNILDDYLEEKIENAITNVMQGLNDDETAKDRLYILSQDKKLLAPLFSAEVHSANSKNPKSNEFPFVITVRSGVTSNNVFGWYKDEESAKAELKNVYNAIKFAVKNEYAVYEMK